MKLKFFAGFIVFFIVIAVNAQDAAVTSSTYKIRQIMLDQNLVVAETSNSNEVLKPGKVFLVTFPTGKQCSLTMKEKTGSLIILNSSTCSNAQEITKASPIEASVVDIATAAPVVVVDKPVAEPPSSPAQPEVAILKHNALFKKLGFSLHYSSANQILFSDAYATNGTSGGPLEATFRTDSASGFGLSFVEMAPQSWGFMSNFFYELKRNINSLTFKGAGGTATAIATGVKPKVSFFVGEGSLVYRWESFYMPFGINYSVPTLSDYDGTSSVTYSGGLGILVGTGVLINDRASVEFFIRSVAMRLTEVSGTTTVTYETGSMAGFGFGYKLWF